MEEKFICKWCEREFTSYIGLQRHINYCKQNPNAIKIQYSFKICPHCNQEINTVAFTKHENRCDDTGPRDRNKDQSRIYHLDHDDLFCKWCQKEFPNKNSLVQHEIRCKDNSNALNISIASIDAMIKKNQTEGSWNKGLIKETDERVALNALHVKETMIKKSEQGLNHGCCTSEYWTDEKRQEQSDKKVALYLEHPEKHPNAKLAGNRKQMTYPEQLVYDWLISKNIEFNPQYYTDSFDNHYRWVDFYLPTYNLYIEVDGEHWHKESEVDKLKDKFALEVQNIITLRIPAKSRIIETLENYFQ